jgi:hypothetical protein
MHIVDPIHGEEKILTVNKLLTFGSMDLLCQYFLFFITFTETFFLFSIAGMLAS